MFWSQNKLTLSAHTTGFYAITQDILSAMPEIGKVRTGLLHLFLQHTSASLTINENADEMVLTDLQTGLDTLAPETVNYRHQLEGKDDMPGHIKSSLFGVSLTIPVTDGKLALGQWQDIYLCEYRSESHRRSIILTLQGTTNE